MAYIDDEDKRGYGFTPAASVPPATSAPPITPAASVLTKKKDDAQGPGFAGTRAVVSGAVQDVAGQLAAGNYGAAAGQAIRGAAALPVAVAVDTVDPLVNAVTPVLRGVANAAYTAATGDNAIPSGSTTPATAPKASATTAPGRTPAIASQAAVPAGPAAALGGSTSTDPATVAGAPGVQKLVDADGRVSYSNIGFTPGGAASAGPAVQPTPQNVAAADALAARYGVTPGGAQAAGEVPADKALTVLADTGGYGLRDKGYLASRAENMDFDARTQGLSANQAATFYASMRKNAEDNATSRGNAALGADTQRLGFNTQAATAANRLGVDQQRVGIDAARAGADIQHANAGTAEMQARTQAAQGLFAARSKYAQALASGDPKKAAAAESEVRGWTAKFENDKGEKHVPIVTGYTEDGKPIHGVLNQSDGTVKDVPRNIAADPKALAVKADPKLSKDEKVRRLQALGYQ